MKLMILSGVTPARLCSWESYELLRDTVVHFLENDQPSGRFRALHDVGSVTHDAALTVDAVRLRVEAFRAWTGLWKLRLQQPTLRPDQHGRPRSALPRGARQFLRALLSVTNKAAAGDTVQIRLLDSKRATIPAASLEQSQSPECLEDSDERERGA
jgi:hypothetical protein